MNELIHRLQRLGLEQYLDVFIGEGFDTWEILLDIQESDLESLNVKLGHRRKLQRAIAEYRGISYDRLLGSPAQDVTPDLLRQPEPSQTQAPPRETVTAAPKSKRRYRHHPKPDENAPEKPPSAYVLFSNKIREEVKSENLTFTEIAKLVGDRWQKLEPSQKEPFEHQAAALKEAYNIQLSAYKKTSDFKDYTEYLADFKAKHGTNVESKRPKLDAQSSTGSASVASQQDIQDAASVAQSHMRVGSISSMSGASVSATLQTAAGLPLAATSSLSNPMAGLNKTGPMIPRAASPSFFQHSRERRLVGQLSAQSSMSDEYNQTRSDTYDPLPRAGTLSLHTPSGTPPLPSYALGSARSEQSTSSENFAWPVRPQPGGQQYGTVPSPQGPALNLPSPTPASESWRDRAFDAARMTQNPPPPSQSFPSSLSFPPILGSERTPDVARAQTQRTLPPLRQQLQQTQPAANLPGGFPHTQLAHHLAATAAPNPAQPDARLRPTTENEAADTLAGLANISGASSQQSPPPRP